MSRIAVSGELDGETLQIIRCDIYEALGKPGVAHVWVERDSYINSSTDWLYKPVSLSLFGDSGQSKRHFFGFVFQSELIGIQGHSIQYRIKVETEIGFGHHSHTHMIFQQLSVTDIIKSKIDSLGIADYGMSLIESYPTLDYCTQYAESDLAFIDRMMERSGIYYYHEHEQGGSRLIFADSNTTHLQLTNSKFKFLAGAGNDKLVACSEYVISHWQEISTVDATVISQRQFDYLKPHLPYEVSNSTNHDYLIHKECYSYPTNHREQQTSMMDNKVLMEAQTQCQLYTGQTQSPNLCCGYLFTLSEHPAINLNGDYLITQLQYRVVNGEQRSSGSATASVSLICDFKAVPIEQQFRLKQVTASPIVPGSDTAIVVGPEGKEMHTDKYGRVKLQFHWDREGKSDESSSCWVRVSQGWAGSGYGHISIPRIGEEVLVSYLHGNPDFPIVTGRVYNQQMLPPYGMPSDAPVTGWRSKSTPNGSGYNEFILDDSKGSELVRLRAEKDHQETILNDQNIAIGNNQKTNIDNNQEVSVSNNRTTNIGANEELQVQGSIQYQVNGEVKITSNTRITLECSGSKVTLGPDGISIQTGALVKINGAMVKIN